MVQFRVKRKGLQKVPYYSKAVLDAIERANEVEAKEVEKDLLKPTATWQHAVEARINKTKTGFTILIRDKVYAMVEGGTKPHVIRPKRAKALRFNSRFRSKTVPNKLTSRKGMSRPPVRFAKEVKHPGTKPRNFKKVAKERSQKRYPKTLRRFIKEALKKA